MKIRGPEIVTPGGNLTRGDYTRHSFAYVIPAGEAGARRLAGAWASVSRAGARA